MNKYLFTALIAALALYSPQPAQAARKATSYAKAKSGIRADGCIFFAYADGWDTFSKQRCEQLIANPAILKAAGNAVVIPLPIPENPDEARRKKQQKITGDLKIPGAFSYPALIFFDGQEQHCGTLFGSVINSGSTEEIARQVSEYLVKIRERARLLKEAESASGPAKAGLLCKAYLIDGLARPNFDLSKELAQLDPGDSSGARRCWNFDGYAFAANVEEMELEAGLAEVEKVLKDDLYTNRQKQQACTAAIGTLRRKAGIARAADIAHYTSLMEKFDPTTPEAKAASYIRNEWIPSLHYGVGWTPASLPSDTTPVELVGDLPIKEAGSYNVTFTYTGGSQALNIVAVELYDGKMKVSQDRHSGTAGNQHSNNVYTIKANQQVNEPHIFITTDMPQRDSYGKITIEKQ